MSNTIQFIFLLLIIFRKCSASKGISSASNILDETSRGSGDLEAWETEDTIPGDSFFVDTFIGILVCYIVGPAGILFGGVLTEAIFNEPLSAFPLKMSFFLLALNDTIAEVRAFYLV